MGFENPFKEVLDRIKQIDSENDNVKFLFFVHLELHEDAGGIKVSVHAAKENIDAVKEFSNELKSSESEYSLIDTIKFMIVEKLGEEGSFRIEVNKNKNMH